MKLSRLVLNSTSSPSIRGWLGTVWRGMEVPEGNAVASTSKLLLPGLKPDWIAKKVVIPRIPRSNVKMMKEEPKYNFIPTTNRIKTLMIDGLAVGQGRRALHLFEQSLSKELKDYEISSLNGFIWLFFDYSQPKLALEAITMMHRKGYSINTRLAAQLLKTATNDLIQNPRDFDLAVQWLQDGITLQGDMDSMQVETILEILRRLGRTDSILQLFNAYAESLPSDQIPSLRLWSLVISAVGEAGDLVGAKQWFNEWRSKFIKSSNADPITPERPYLALLTQIIANSPSVSAEPYKFLPLLEKDNVPLSTTVFNSLLQLELSRRQYLSFWGLWKKMKEGNWKKDVRTWKLGIKAKKWEDGAIRRRARITGSRLQFIAGYSDEKSPNYRTLYSDFLTAHQLETNSRPSLILPKSKQGIMVVEILNSFLGLFVSISDWTAAVIVLETFSVAKVEPNNLTHGNLVIGIVRAWERGKLQRAGELEIELGFRFDREQTRKLGSLEMLRKILEKRKMRIQLWTGGGSEYPVPTIELIPDEEPKEEENNQKLFTLPLGPPTWMQKRELRDTTYLVELLQKCEEKNDEEWKEALRLTREELLPSQRQLFNSESRRSQRLAEYKASIRGNRSRVS